MGSARPADRREALRAPAALPCSARPTEARCARSRARRPEQPAEIGSRNVPHDERAEQSREGHGERLPCPDQPRIFRVLRADVGVWTAVARPAVPIERNGPRTPLLLESKGAAARRRASEVEGRESLTTRVLERRVVQEHVGRKPIVAPIGRGPRNLQRVLETVQKPRRHGLPPEIDYADPRIFRKLFQNRFEKAPPVHGRSQIAHVPCEDPIEVVEELDAFEAYRELLPQSSPNLAA